MNPNPEILVRQVMERTGLNESQAKDAVDVVKKFVLQRVPPVTHSQFERIFSGMTLEESLKNQVQEVGGELKDRAEGLANDLKTAFEKTFGNAKKPS